MRGGGGAYSLGSPDVQINSPLYEILKSRILALPGGHVESCLATGGQLTHAQASIFHWDKKSN